MLGFYDHNCYVVFIWFKNLYIVVVEVRKMANSETVIGRRFGRLVAIEVLGQKNGKTMIKVQCDCGNLKEMVLGNFTASGSKSCGCLNLENIKRRKKSWQF